MITVERDEVVDVCDEYRLILETEVHHDHEIVKDESGTLRWKPNLDVIKYRENISLNDLCPLLKCLGYGQNSEVYRKLYRDMGYSLFGYWEIFYWEVNNDDASEYAPPKTI